VLKQCTAFRCGMPPIVGRCWQWCSVAGMVLPQGATSAGLEAAAPVAIATSHTPHLTPWRSCRRASLAARSSAFKQLPLWEDIIVSQCANRGSHLACLIPWQSKVGGSARKSHPQASRCQRRTHTP
jgi:hypothetical protein